MVSSASMKRAGRMTRSAAPCSIGWAGGGISARGMARADAARLAAPSARVARRVICCIFVPPRHGFGRGHTRGARPAPGRMHPRLGRMHHKSVGAAGSLLTKFHLDRPLALAIGELIGNGVARMAEALCRAGPDDAALVDHGRGVAD